MRVMFAVHCLPCLVLPHAIASTLKRLLLLPLCIITRPKPLTSLVVILRLELLLVVVALPPRAALHTMFCAHVCLISIIQPVLMVPPSVATVHRATPCMRHVSIPTALGSTNIIIINSSIFPMVSLGYVPSFMTACDAVISLCRCQHLQSLTVLYSQGRLKLR
jgi:hypothetical protein